MGTRKSTEDDCLVCEYDYDCKMKHCVITENPDEPIEKEKNCPNHCPFCNSTDIDWGKHYSVDDNWYHQRAVCLSCNNCFIEVTETIYRSTLITEEK
jgi:hypothetical protein